MRHSRRSSSRAQSRAARSRSPARWRWRSRRSPRCCRSFWRKFPQVRLQLQVSNRRVDVLSEGIDVALRVRAQPTGEDGLVMRVFGQLEEFLVASPGYLARAGALERAGAAGARTRRSTTRASVERRPWELVGPEGAHATAELTPRMVCHDFVVLRAAVLAGLGIAHAAGERGARGPEVRRADSACCRSGTVPRASCTSCFPAGAGCCRRCALSSISSPSACQR